MKRSLPVGAVALIGAGGIPLGLASDRRWELSPRARYRNRGSDLKAHVIFRAKPWRLEKTRWPRNQSRSTLSGLGGGEYLFARGGVDVLNGGAGDDFLAGRAAADAINGGDGSDTASYSDALAGLRADLGAPATNTGDASGDTYSSIENLLGSKFNDLLYGNNSDNVISGGIGIDSLYGAGGADTLFGGDGNDFLLGQGGNNRLDGGAGNDILTGGLGSKDWFAFGGVWGNDVLTDFENNVDVLDLRAAVTSYAALQIVQQGADVLVTLTGMGSILLVDEMKANITASDFLFT